MRSRSIWLSFGPMSCFFYLWLMDCLKRDSASLSLVGSGDYCSLSICVSESCASGVGLEGVSGSTGGSGGILIGGLGVSGAGQEML